MADKSVPKMNDDALQQLRQIAESSTVIGDPIHTSSGTTILPVSKIKMAYGLGGMDFTDEKKENAGNFSGGSGGGVSMTPVAFLTVSPSGGVSLLQVADRKQSADRALNLLPGLMQQLSDIIEKKTGIGAPKAPKSSKSEESDGNWASYIKDMPTYEETVMVEEKE